MAIQGINSAISNAQFFGSDITPVKRQEELTDITLEDIEQIKLPQHVTPRSTRYGEYDLPCAQMIKDHLIKRGASPELANNIYTELIYSLLQNGEYQKILALYKSFKEIAEGILLERVNYTLDCYQFAEGLLSHHRIR